MKLDIFQVKSLMANAPEKYRNIIAEKWGKQIALEEEIEMGEEMYNEIINKLKRPNDVIIYPQKIYLSKNFYITYDEKIYPNGDISIHNLKTNVK